MTKQDNTNKVKLAIKFGGRFLAQKEEKGNLYPRERLSKFLNIDIKNEEEIIDYCNKYRFVPRDMTVDLIKSFRKEHNQIKKMALKLSTGKSTFKDLSKVDRIIGTIQKQLRYTSGQILLKDFNKVSGGMSQYIPNDLIRSKYLSWRNHYSGTIVSLWQDMINQIIIDQNIQPCRECGQYFWITKQAKEHKYCTVECRNKKNQRISYHRKFKKSEQISLKPSLHS